MIKLCLYGASGHAKVISDIAKSNDITKISLIDDNKDIKELKGVGVKVYHSSQLILFTEYNFIISIGNNKVRKDIVYKNKLNYTKLIHPSAIVSADTSIGEGTVVMPGVIINADVTIGKHTIINTSAVIEHNCVIEDFVHVSPNATLTGNVTVGEGTHIGAGVIIIPQVKIGKWSVIGAGSVIIKDIPDYSIVVGNPGRIIRSNKNE